MKVSSWVSGVVQKVNDGQYSSVEQTRLLLGMHSHSVCAVLVMGAAVYWII